MPMAVPVITKAALEEAREEASPTQKQRTETREDAHNRYLSAMSTFASMPDNAPAEAVLDAKRAIVQAKADHERHRSAELEASAKVNELTAKVNKLQRWERVESPVTALARDVKRLKETVKARDDMAQRYNQDHPWKAALGLGQAKEFDRETQEAKKELAKTEKALAKAEKSPEVIAHAADLAGGVKELAKAKEAFEPHRLMRMQEIKREREQGRELSRDMDRGR